MSTIGHCAYLAGCERFIKIGITMDVKSRMRALATGSPRPVTLIAQIAAGRDAKRLEKQLHVRFSCLRVRGEWFLHEGDLCDFVDALSLAKDAWTSRRITDRFLLGHEPPDDQVTVVIKRLQALGKDAIKAERALEAGR